MGFAKVLDVQNVRSTKNCVIYTRVSSKEQAENNTSLTSQKMYCEEYCKKNGYAIKAYFGGTFESAKGDERKEFKKMLEYVRINKSIDTILVYSYDRFSRSGTNAAYLSQELQKTGVKVNAVSQQIDTSSPSGRLHRDMLYLFSQFDNEPRKDKVVNGMIENLRQGYWVAAPPFGYTNLNRKEKVKNHKYIINEQGELLKEGFRLKAETSLTNKEIVAKLRKKGCKVNYKSFTRILTNPFYCGYIVHALIPAEIYQGGHPALVTEVVFAEANKVISGEPRSGISKKHKVNELPLKMFAKAQLCDAIALSDNAAGTATPLTGYRKKGIYYYKTYQAEKAVNVNAKHLNNLFTEELRKYEYENKHTDKLKEEIKWLITERLSGQLNEQTQLKKQLTELTGKIEKPELRFINSELTKELFEKYDEKFREEKAGLERKLANSRFDSSNLENIIDRGLKIAQNASKLWHDWDYDDKQDLQKLIYPEGIIYNKKKDIVRTPRINSFFEPIPQLVSFLEGNEKSHLFKGGLNSRLVVPTGIEPVSKV